MSRGSGRKPRTTPPGPSPDPEGRLPGATPDPERDGAVPIPIPDGDQAVTIPIEDALDLHPFAPRDIPGVVTDYLEACVQRGMREVRLIHGRGIGAQRAVVRSLLGRLPMVAGFVDAPPERGGWGATVVYLRTEPPAP